MQNLTDINPKIGFASIRVFIENGAITGESAFKHKFPVGESAETIDTAKLEKELLDGVTKLVNTSPLITVAKLGFFIEYTKEFYPR